MKKIFRQYLFLWVIVILIGLLSVFLIAALQPEDPSDLNQVLIWLAVGPGALFVAGNGLSYFLEIFPGWGSKILVSWRPWIVLALTVGLAFGAKALLAYDGLVSQISPAFKMLFTVIAAWIGSQFAYARLKSSGMRAGRKLPF